MRFVPSVPSPPVALLAAALALSLSGCLGNSVTVAGQGYTGGTRTKTVECGDSAELALGIQGAGHMSVTVLDGKGAKAYQHGSLSAGQDGQAESLRGQGGTWVLKVATGLGYSGQYGITLSC